MGTRGILCILSISVESRCSRARSRDSILHPWTFCKGNFANDGHRGQRPPQRHGHRRRSQSTTDFVPLCLFPAFAAKAAALVLRGDPLRRVASAEQAVSVVFAFSLALSRPLPVRNGAEPDASGPAARFFGPLFCALQLDRLPRRNKIREIGSGRASRSHVGEFPVVSGRPLRLAAGRSRWTAEIGGP